MKFVAKVHFKMLKIVFLRKLMYYFKKMYLLCPVIKLKTDDKTNKKSNTFCRSRIYTIVFWMGFPKACNKNAVSNPP